MKPFYSSFILVGLLLLMKISEAQNPSPVKHFERSDFSAADSIHLLNTYGKNKVLIPRFALQSLIALSYFPELKNTYIRFILMPAHSPLCTRPVFPSVLREGDKRYFTITISDSTMWKLEPITLQHMDFNAQVGVLGHELSHVSDFSRRSLLNLAGTGIGHLSSKYIDKFEYRTDSICIAHGLGYQLLSWSIFVRETLNTKDYDGADNIDKPMQHERYMNPPTIMERMKTDVLYKKLN